MNEKEEKKLNEDIDGDAISDQELNSLVSSLKNKSFETQVLMNKEVNGENSEKIVNYLNENNEYKPNKEKRRSVDKKKSKSNKRKDSDEEKGEYRRKDKSRSRSKV